jgi:hypothetical protein
MSRKVSPEGHEELRRKGLAKFRNDPIALWEWHKRVGPTT